MLRIFAERIIERVAELLRIFAGCAGSLTASSDSRGILSDSHGGSGTLLPFPRILVDSSLPSRFLISSTEVWKIIGV